MSKSSNSRAKILLADDSVTMHRAVSLGLKKEAFDVVYCDNGQDALRLTREHRPLIVLADLDMPGLTGAELCRSIKDDPALNSEVKVILLCGSFDQVDEKEIESIPADARLWKPFESHVLVSMIHTLLKIPPKQSADATEQMPRPGSVLKDSAPVHTPAEETEDIASPRSNTNVTNLESEDSSLHLPSDALAKKRNEGGTGSEPTVGAIKPPPPPPPPPPLREAQESSQDETQAMPVQSKSPTESSQELPQSDSSSPTQPLAQENPFSTTESSLEASDAEEDSDPVDETPMRPFSDEGEFTASVAIDGARENLWGDDFEKLSEEAAEEPKEAANESSLEESYLPEKDDNFSDFEILGPPPEEKESTNDEPQEEVQKMGAEREDTEAFSGFDESQPQNTKTEALNPISPSAKPSLGEEQIRQIVRDEIENAISSYMKGRLEERLQNVLKMIEAKSRQ